jgi:hypothetical protein
MMIRVALELPGGVPFWESVIVELDGKPGSYVLVKPDRTSAESIRRALNETGELIINVTNLGESL